MSTTDTPDTPKVSLVWERPGQEDAIAEVLAAEKALREAEADVEKKVGAKYAAIWRANRRHHVTQPALGELLGVTKSRINAIVVDYEERRQREEGGTTDA